MDRKKFLETIGIGAAFVLTSTCLGGCAKDKITGSSNIDESIDLNDKAFEALKTPSGFVVHNGIVISRSLSGKYLAATQSCSHEGLKQIIFNASDQWQCTAHGALFDTEGKGLNANGSKGLTIYKTEKIGNTLRIFS